jgi:hypothetical protein
LVLINGGLNDIGLENILNPLTTADDLSGKISLYCYQGMKALLTLATNIFTKPNCRFVVTGYYPILSPDSDLFSLAGAERLDFFLSLRGLRIPPHLDRDPITNHIVDLAMQFWHGSDAALSQAVNEVAVSQGIGNRLIFVPIPFGIPNALFAGNPLLFGLNPDFSPQDEIVAERKQACNLKYPDPLNLVTREICYHASVGHPNVAGSQAIAATILNVL